MRPGRDPSLPLAFSLAGVAAIGLVCAVAAAGPARVAGLAGVVTGTRIPAPAASPPAGAPRPPERSVAGHGLRQPSLLDQTRSTPPSGILDTHAGPFPPADFTVRNAWRGQVGSSVVWAYAGAAAAGKASPGGPALRLYVQPEGDGDSRATLLGTYAAPGADGPLAIASAEGAILTLRTDRGGVYHFDLRRRRFA